MVTAPLRLNLMFYFPWEKGEIPFYSPQLVGFGIGSTHLLEVTTADDQLRYTITITSY
ncbi:hypothetical protein [Coxiella endosymbiont of Ornithodoros maritimus]|uniref:hypothetical protein n=1 Tax=Coxiella endosymbiont of Ornithodoros maritimus TaxID=1656172 RepID=UPI0022654947|nr:hypothetical protein [Coxiella endosymbiont of Ornithodoros maritimus]